jgi:type IV pilus assembly protein PilE
MSTMDTALGRRPVRRGFTLIELMIVMIVVAILAAVAYPSFQDSIRKSRRSEAFTALSQIQQAEEKHRSQHPTFTTLITAATTADPAGLGFPATRTQSGYYDLAVTTTAATTSYIASATAVTGTSQANDGPCAALAVRMAGGNITYGAAATVAGIDWSNPDPKRCWAR